MFNFYKQMRIVPKVVIPVALILVLGLGLLAWQIQWRSAAAVTDVAKRELAALGGENGNLIRAFSYDCMMNGYRVMKGDFEGFWFREAS